MWGWSDDPWYKSLMRATHGFRSTAASSVILWYDPALDQLETAFFRLACDQQSTSIERLLGARLRPWWMYPRRLRVYLFQSADDVSQVYGWPAGGFASWDQLLIVVNLEAEWREILRHELAHIIGGRWNPAAPTLLCEGLAVWAQRTISGYPLDRCARLAPSEKAGVLDWLLSPEPAIGSVDRQRYYALAGSFTGALIRRFGLSQYRRFYKDRNVTLATLAGRFKKCFGFALESIAQDWLADLSSPSVGRNMQAGLR